MQTAIDLITERRDISRKCLITMLTENRADLELMELYTREFCEYTGALEILAAADLKSKRKESRS